MRSCPFLTFLGIFDSFPRGHLGTHKEGSYWSKTLFMIEAWGLLPLPVNIEDENMWS